MNARLYYDKYLVPNSELIIKIILFKQIKKLLQKNLKILTQIWFTSVSVGSIFIL